ncbi:MAG TPA: RNA polymerase sigma factor [Blastocatellia bacterium]|nr:RNA polymerase sigma factor [Blastocatellia bacterium]
MSDENIQIEGDNLQEQSKNRKPISKLPDDVLVISAILGDIIAFDELVIRYRPAVYRVAQSIAGDTLAEDIVQDSFLLAFKALPSVEDPAKFPSWLYAITRHQAMRVGQKEKRTQFVEIDEILLEYSRVLSTPHPAAEPEVIDELRSAIEELPESQRLVVKLRFYDDMSLKRIAQFLSLPLTTVKWRLHRAKESLRKSLESEWEKHALLRAGGKNG